MPVFEYAAQEASGRRRQGRLQADSANALVTELRGRGWLIFKIQPVGGSGQMASRSTSGTGVEYPIGFATTGLPWWRPSSWLPVASLDVELSLQQLAVLLRSGLTLLSALQTIRQNVRRPRMALIWERVAQQIQAGASFADALAQHRCFSQLVLQLIRVGEQTGNLELVLQRAADALERRRILQQSLLTALAYPSLVFVIALGIAGFLVFNVIPKVEKFLHVLGRRLPPMTQLLVDVATFCKDYVFHGLILISALTIGLILLYLWNPGRLFCDRWLLRIPIFGPLFRLSGTAMFARGLGVLLRSGVTLLESLQTVEPLLGNYFLRERVAVARQQVIRGSNLASSLSVPYSFTPMLTSMVQVGETSGTLDEILDEVADFHEAQLQASLKRLSVLVEPAIIIVVGGLVGFVYIAFFLALFAAGGSGR